MLELQVALVVFATSLAGLYPLLVMHFRQLANSRPASCARRLTTLSLQPIRGRRNLGQQPRPPRRIRDRGNRRLCW